MSRALMSSRAVTAIFASFLVGTGETGRVGCAQYRPKPAAEANRVWPRVPRPRAQLAPDRGRRYVVRSDWLHDDGPGGRGGQCERSARVALLPLGNERGRARDVERDAGTRDDDDVSEVEQLPPAMPLRKAEECVGADDERERPRPDPRRAAIRASARCNSGRRDRFRAGRTSSPATPAMASSTIARRWAAEATGAARCGGRRRERGAPSEARAPCAARARARGARRGSDRTCRRECRSARVASVVALTRWRASMAAAGHAARRASRHGRSPPRRRAASASLMTSVSCSAWSSARSAASAASLKRRSTAATASRCSRRGPFAEWRWSRAS